MNPILKFCIVSTCLSALLILGLISNAICEEDNGVEIGVWIVDGWRIKLHAPSYPSTAIIKVGEKVEVEFVAYNKDTQKRVMYDTEIEMRFPQQVSPIQPFPNPKPEEQEGNKLKWSNVEQYRADSIKGQGVMYMQSWWHTVRAQGRYGTEGKSVPVSVAMKWRDKDGNRYDTGKRVLKNVIVEGPPLSKASYSLSLMHGRTIPWQTIGIKFKKPSGLAYEVDNEYHLSSKLSVVLSFGFQTYQLEDQTQEDLTLIPLSIKAAYSLYGAVGKPFQFRPFIGFGLNMYHFGSPSIYQNTNTSGIDAGFITEYTPSSSPHFGFLLQGSVNYTAPSDFSTTYALILFGFKYNG